MASYIDGIISIFCHFCVPGSIPFFALDALFVIKLLLEKFAQIFLV